jgi:hypothetical protein
MNVTLEEFTSKMAECGKIISIRLRDYEQQSKNGEKYINNQIGYVMYETVQQAQKCIQKFDHSSVFGFGKKPLRVDFWQSKYDIKNQKEEKNINKVKSIISIIQ